MSKPAKTDLRIRRTRKLLSQAFQTLVDEKGLAAMTVSDIAERAMINRATFYAHFSDKYDLFAYIVRQSFQEKVCNTVPRDAEFNRENLKPFLQAIFEFMGTFDSGCQQPPRAQFWPTIVAQIQQQLYDLLLDWLTTRSRVALTAKVETTAVFMSWSIFGAALQWGQIDPKEPLADLVEELLVLLENGLYQQKA